MIRTALFTSNFNKGGSPSAIWQQESSRVSISEEDTWQPEGEEGVVGTLLAVTAEKLLKQAGKSNTSKKIKSYNPDIDTVTTAGSVSIPGPALLTDLFAFVAFSRWEYSTCTPSRLTTTASV